MSKEFREWSARLKYISTEYPFGDLEEFRNEEGRLHREGGPAFISPTRCSWYVNGQRHGLDVDKFGSMAFYFRGISVPRHYIMSPETLTVKEILGNKNTEVRYAGMLIYGYERMVSEGHLKLMHGDRKGERKLFLAKGILPVDFKVVRVLNSTPELDGSFKPYYLTVPAEVKTCQEAVAWTFGMEAKEYNPSQET